jgi:hypothetical protein
MLGLRRHAFAGGWDGRTVIRARGAGRTAGGGRTLKTQKLLSRVKNAQIQGYRPLIGQPQRAPLTPDLGDQRRPFREIGNVLLLMCARCIRENHVVSFRQVSIRLRAGEMDSAPTFSANLS